MVVVSNLSHEPASLTVSLDLKKLGIPSGARAQDVISGRKIDLKEGKFGLTLPSLG